MPEVLFFPTDIGITQMGISETVVECINSCPPETHPHLYNNILVVGGCANFPGFKERLEKDLRAMAPDDFDVTVHLPEK